MCTSTGSMFTKGNSVKSILFIFIIPTLLFSAPTYKEYEECIEKTKNGLHYCLMINSQLNKNDFCWQKSKEAYTRCYLDLIDSHEKKTNETTTDESMHIGHNHYKKQAIKKAKTTKRALQNKHKTLIQKLKNTPLTGDEEHDKTLLDSIQQNQKDWIHYQFSFCQTRALAEVYPSTSRLYTQTFNSCLNELNIKRIEYIDNLIMELEQ